MKISRPPKLKWTREDAQYTTRRSCFFRRAGRKAIRR
jgi:hypothetical protein